MIAALVLEVYLTRKYRNSQPLRVKLALNNENLKRMKQMDGPAAFYFGKDGDSLPVGESHDAFVAATEQYNAAVAEALKAQQKACAADTAAGTSGPAEPPTPKAEK